jgi:hypothetical protein
VSDLLANSSTRTQEENHHEEAHQPVRVRVRSLARRPGLRRGDANAPAKEDKGAGEKKKDEKKAEKPKTLTAASEGRRPRRLRRPRRRARRRKRLRSRKRKREVVSSAIR